MKLIKLKFRIPCNTQFRLFLRKIKTSQFIKVQVLEFDSFASEKDAELRRQNIRRTIKKLGSKIQNYLVYSTVKGWKTKRVQRNLIFHPNGDIRLIGDPEEVNNSNFNLSDVYQLVWSENVETPQMPTLAFTFKD